MKKGYKETETIFRKHLFVKPDNSNSNNDSQKDLNFYDLLSEL
jgi:hypothetical protein